MVLDNIFGSLVTKKYPKNRIAKTYSNRIIVRFLNERIAKLSLHNFNSESRYLYLTKQFFITEKF